MVLLLNLEICTRLLPVSCSALASSEEKCQELWTCLPIRVTVVVPLCVLVEWLLFTSSLLALRRTTLDKAIV